MIVDLIRSTRPEDEKCPADIREAIWYGAGPRAGISLVSMSRAYALLQGHEVIRWHHIKRMAKPVLRHRIRITVHAGRDKISEERIIDDIVDRLEQKYKFLAKGIN